jgi:hypothetical protein
VYELSCANDKRIAEHTSNKKRVHTPETWWSFPQRDFVLLNWKSADRQDRMQQLRFSGQTGNQSGCLAPWVDLALFLMTSKVQSFRHSLE